MLPCGAADHYKLLCTDYIVVAVHYDLFGLADGALVGVSNDQSVNALYRVAKALIAVDRCAGIDTSAGAVGNSHRIAGNGSISCYPPADLQLEECYILGVVVLQVQLAHDIAHNVLVGILGGSGFVVTGYSAEYLVLDRCQHLHHQLFLLPRADIVLKGAACRMAGVIVDEIAAEDEMGVLLLYPAAKGLPALFIVQDAAQMHIRYRIDLDGVILRDLSDYQIQRYRLLYGIKKESALRYSLITFGEADYCELAVCQRGTFLTKVMYLRPMG